MVIASIVFQLEDVLEKLKDGGKIDLAKYVKKIQDLKTDNRMKEKQIIGLVKTSNKLQDACEFFEKENSVLR